MGRLNTFGKMDKNMRVSGRTDIKMAVEFGNQVKEIAILVSGLMER